jgi:hypothetical protein
MPLSLRVISAPPISSNGVGENLRALLSHFHVGDQRVDLALLQELHTIGWLDRDHFDVHAKVFCEVLSEVDVKAEWLLRGWVERAERRSGQDHADHDFVAFVNAV